MHYYFSYSIKAFCVLLDEYQGSETSFNCVLCGVTPTWVWTWMQSSKKENDIKKSACGILMFIYCKCMLTNSSIKGNCLLQGVIQLYIEKTASTIQAGTRFSNQYSLRYWYHWNWWSSQLSHVHAEGLMELCKKCVHGCTHSALCAWSNRSTSKWAEGDSSFVLHTPTDNQTVQY